MIAKKILEKEGMGDMVPAISGVLEFENEDEGEAEGLPYYTQEKVLLISMNRVNGVNLEDLILNYPENSEILEKLNFEAFAQKLEDALNRWHAAGLCHKDISIRNIMIDLETAEPKIIDFGKAKRTSDQTEIQEENDLRKNVLNHLRSFKADPAAKKSKLQESYKKFEEKF